MLVSTAVEAYSGTIGVINGYHTDCQASESLVVDECGQWYSELVGVISRHRVQKITEVVHGLKLSAVELPFLELLVLLLGVSDGVASFLGSVRHSTL